MAERKRCCCNCGNCRRVDKGTYKENYCVIDGHYIGYIETFEGWCRRWKKAHTLTEGARTMTDKKELIELICKSHLPIMFADDTVGKYCIGQEDAERIADHLIANGVTVQEWISVKDRLPEDGEIVLVCGSRGGVYTAVFNKPGWYRGWHKLNSKSHYCDPTHWMPLPQPPKGE